MTEIRITKTVSFEHLNFEFVSVFDIRVSDLLNRQREVSIRMIDYETECPLYW